jgi:hypothetical protein
MPTSQPRLESIKVHGDYKLNLPEFLDESQEHTEKEDHSTEEHVTKTLSVTKDHAKHEQKPKEKTTPAPQTNHVSDEHAEASE